MSSKDFKLGVLMVAAIVLVPNLFQAIVACLGLGNVSMGQKLLLICALNAGGALAGPSLFGMKGPSSKSRYTVLLGLAGAAAATYFLAVVGLGNQAGFGAGFAESIDSTVSPAILAFVACAAGTAAISRRLAGGVLFSFLGLATVSAAVITGSFNGFPHFLATGGYLVPFALIGAFGTPLSIWLVRRLRHDYGADLGYCLAIRYGVVAIIYLAVAILFFRGQILLSTPFIVALAAAFVTGAVFLSLAYYAAVNLHSDWGSVVALSIVPLAAIAIEGILHALRLNQSNLPFDNPLLWSGGLVSALGIWLMRSQPKVDETDTSNKRPKLHHKNRKRALRSREPSSVSR